MAKDISATLTVDGWVNVLTALRAAGYAGRGTPNGEVTILNMTTTVCYIHFADDGTSAYSGAATAADGLPISTDTSNAPGASYTAPKGVDLATLWLNTGSSISVRVSVIGG